MSVTTKTNSVSTLPPDSTVSVEPTPVVDPVLGVPPRLRRRPLLLVGSVALVVLGALLGLWLWTAAGTSVEVLAARSVVHRGEVIAPDDLMVVRVGLDPALQTVPADRLDAVAGSRAALDLPAGGLLTPDGFNGQVVPAGGMSVVGVGVVEGMLPAELLLPGDVVRVVQTPGPQGELDSDPVTVVVSVVRVSASDATDLVVVDVLVPADQAAQVAALAASGRVALVLDSRER